VVDSIFSPSSNYTSFSARRLGGMMEYSFVGGNLPSTCSACAYIVLY